MADSAFANAGLGMFGADTGIAKQMSTPESLSERMQKAAGGGGGGANPLALLAAYAVNKLSDNNTDGGAAGGGGPNIFQQITGAMVPAQYRSIGISPPQNSQAVSAPQAAQPTVTTPPTTTGGYRSFFSPQGFGSN